MIRMGPTQFQSEERWVKEALWVSWVTHWEDISHWRKRRSHWWEAMPRCHQSGSTWIWRRLRGSGTRMMVAFLYGACRSVKLLIDTPFWVIREHLDVSRRGVKSVLSLKGDRDWHVEKTQFIREWLSRTALRPLRKWDGWDLTCTWNVDHQELEQMWRSSSGRLF